MKMKDCVNKCRKIEKIVFFATIIAWIILPAWDSMANIGVFLIAIFFVFAVSMISVGIYCKIVPAEYDEEENCQQDTYNFLSGIVFTLMSLVCFIFLAFAYHYGDDTRISNRMVIVDEDIKSYNVEERSIRHTTTSSECKAIEMLGSWPLYWPTGEFETIKLNLCKSLDK